MSAEHPLVREKMPPEYYFDIIKQIFKETPIRGEDSRSHSRTIENNKVKLGIREIKIDDKEGFYVGVNNFGYWIGKDGIHAYITAPVRNSSKPRDLGMKAYVYNNRERRDRAEDLVGWVARMVSADTVLPYPYQPSYGRGL